MAEMLIRLDALLFINLRGSIGLLNHISEGVGASSKFTLG